MYPLPPEHDLQFLIGTTVMQVCVGSNEAILHFHENVSITIEAEPALIDAAGESTDFESWPHAASKVVALLNQEVVRAARLDGRTLELRFRNGVRLRLHDRSNEYESFQIRHGDRLIVV
jgi:hypothetical protein